jgi:hypothetical protein
LQSVLWEARPQLRDDADIARMARFIIATLEGALMVSRVNRDVTQLESIGVELKRFIAVQRREAVPAPVGP